MQKECASMLDHAKKWTEIPDWETATIEGRGLFVRTVNGLSQHLVSGDIEGFRRAFGLPDFVGGLGQASGERYAARMARDRALVIGVEDLAAGWHDTGVAVTKMNSALHVFEVSGKSALDLVERGAVMDAGDAGPNSATVFAGVITSLYRHGSATTLRLHVDRGLAPYLWAWIGSQRMMADVAQVDAHGQRGLHGRL
jgi:hypothetical protein